MGGGSTNEKLPRALWSEERQPGSAGPKVRQRIKAPAELWTEQEQRSDTWRLSVPPAAEGGEPPSVLEHLEDVLHRLQRRVRATRGAAVLSTDGFPLASLLPNAMDDTLIASLGAILQELGSQVAQELHRVPPRAVIVASDRGYVVLRAAGQDVVVLVMADATAPLGLLLLELNRVAREVERIL